MKKINYFVCILLLGCLVSCGYYVPEKDYSERLSKVEYKSFNSLNNPFIFRFDADLDFVSKDDGRAQKRQRGSYYVIYDWETDTIFDYVYSPKDNSYTNLLIQCKNADNNFEYFTLNVVQPKNFRVFSMEGSNNTVEESFLNNKEVLKDVKYMNLGNINSQQRKDHLILYHNGIDEIILLYFDINSKTITKEKRIEMDDDSVDVYVDSEGICWYLERFENEENKKRFETICSYDFVTDTEIKDYFVFDCIGDSNTYDTYKGWICEDFYEIEFVDSNFIVLEKNSYDRSGENEKGIKSYIVIDRNDKSQKEFALDDSEDDIIDFEKIQNKYFFIIDKDTLDYNFEIKKINLETLEQESLLKQDFLWYSKMEIRDNRIYFISKHEWEQQEAEIHYFDILDNKFYECEKIVLEEYFENLK